AGGGGGGGRGARGRRGRRAGGAAPPPAARRPGRRDHAAAPDPHPLRGAGRPGGPGADRAAAAAPAGHRRRARPAGPGRRRAAAEIARVEPVPPQPGAVEWSVMITLTARGQAAWSPWTAAHVGSQVAFTVDGRVQSAPSIQDAITGATLVSGSLTRTTATD